MRHKTQPKYPCPTSWQAITTLLLLAFDPVTEPCARFRQGLTVLFEVLAALSLPAQDLLATALLPAARR